MYENFFGFRERPFDLLPNPRFLCLTKRHREALSNLVFGITSRKGVVVLTGEAGTGKTTVARAVIEKQRAADVKCVYLYNPLLTRLEFLQFLARELSLSRAANISKTDLMSELVDSLEHYRERGKTVALLVDEAQSLSDELFEEIRLLTNIETTHEKLMTLVLVGQPELADRLNNEALRSLKQRVELRCTLRQFELPETVAYIWSRIHTAGGDGSKVFTLEAVHLIHERSRGIPRSISVICENALISGFAEQEKPVTRRLVLEVCDEFDLQGLPKKAQAADIAAEAAPAAISQPAQGQQSAPSEPRQGPRRLASAAPERGNASSRRSAAVASTRRWRLFT